MIDLYSQNKVKAGLEMKTIYVRQQEHDEASDRPATVIINTESLRGNGYEILQRHINKGLEPRWAGVEEESPNLATVLGEAETVWQPWYGVSSLLLIFVKGRERLSLQIFRNYKRAELKIVTAKHRRDQNEENIFWEHVRPWQNDGDRVSKPLPEGGHVSASVKIAAVNLRRDFQAIKNLPSGESFRVAESKEPVHVVSVTIDKRAFRSSDGATTTNRQQQRDWASSPGEKSGQSWTRAVPVRARDQVERRSDDKRKYY
jgi:hypothetical protein